MNKQIKKQWIHALRSGEYRQNEGQLHTTEGFCCLGVLCDIYYDGYWAKVNSDVYKLEGIKEGEEDVFSLPESLRKELKIPGSYERLLTNMNDSGVSFTKIADWIEERL